MCSVMLTVGFLFGPGGNLIVCSVMLTVSFFFPQHGGISEWLLSYTWWILIIFCRCGGVPWWLLLCFGGVSGAGYVFYRRLTGANHLLQVGQCLCFFSVFICHSCPYSGMYHSVFYGDFVLITHFRSIKYSFAFCLSFSFITDIYVVYCYSCKRATGVEAVWGGPLHSVFLHSCSPVQCRFFVFICVSQND